MKNGTPALPVSLMIPDRLTQPSRAERKIALKEQFQHRLQGLENKGLEVDFNSISPSGQTIKAKLSVASIERMVAELQFRNLQVFPDTQQQVIHP